MTKDNKYTPIKTIANPIITEPSKDKIADVVAATIKHPHTQPSDEQETPILNIPSHDAAKLAESLGGKIVQQATEGAFMLNVDQDLIEIKFIAYVNLKKDGVKRVMLGKNHKYNVFNLFTLDSKTKLLSEIKSIPSLTGEKYLSYAYDYFSSDIHVKPHYYAVSREGADNGWYVVVPDSIMDIQLGV